MLITDLDDDCLRKISERLDFQSLINISRANKHLGTAARDVYKIRFGIRRVCLLTDLDEMGSGGFNAVDNNVHVFGLKFHLEFLRCFGSAISNIFIYIYIYITL